MKTAHYIIIITLCFFSINYAQSTDNTSNNDNTNKSLIPTTLKQISNNVGAGEKAVLSVINNQANIEQVGMNNKAVINQSLNNGTSSNIASITQNNNNNYASITQNGSGNTNTIAQSGNGNKAITNIDGNNNITNIVQNGNNNIATQNITGSSRVYSLMQLGNSNLITKYDNEINPKGLIITQKGNGLHLIINGNNIIK